MSVSPISAGAPAYQLDLSGSVGKTAKSPVGTEISTAKQEAGPVATPAVDKAPAIKQPKAPVGIPNHVVVSYNDQGKMRTKFEDSRNNVVYQIPSEIAASLEEQMKKPKTSADTIT